LPNTFLHLCNMLTYLLGLAAFFSIYWVGTSKNSLTKFSGLALGFSILLQYVTYGGIGHYAAYAFAFFTLFAGFEPTGSFRFKMKHKIIFVYASIFSCLLVTQDLINVPIRVPFELFLIPVPFLSIWLWKSEKKVVYQRMGFLVVWSAQAVVGLFYSDWLGSVLSELL